MTRLWWVRHAPTHLRTLAPRDAPADLSAAAQLARLGAFLPQAPILPSALPRAIQTAHAIAQTRPILPPNPGLNEFHHGTWEGLTWDEIGRTWPTLSRAYLETPGTPAPPGGESWNDATARISAAADALIGPPDLILVSHMGTILTQLARARALPAAEILAQSIVPLSVTRLHWTGTSWAEDFANHLP